ncbi:MAG: hypothetical protein CM15mP86_05500 [Gammaproteobacteria bacterium]|nr:MAG: hypothetical protein CM15mP86_05500 [Gammaproteobacteria bacterium]
MLQGPDHKKGNCLVRPRWNIYAFRHNPGIEDFLRNLHKDTSLKFPTCSVALLSTANNSLWLNKLITPKKLKSQ